MSSAGDVSGLPASGDPVFVLCGGRSGSTLLRFILDAHPHLACPPEWNLPVMASQLATVWSLIEGAPLAAERGDEPPKIPDAAISGVRRTLDEMTASYLARCGKKRYCDKSLGTARFAELLLRVYPGAKFLCLYRHPMDVIASGAEACPWGLSGYGFDPYISSTPGNAVLALARFWADNASAILATEEKFKDSCHRVRYEDLVEDPESVAGGIFDFLGVPSSPGISSRCFTRDRERSGPADYKIWHTAQVTAGSVGRGWAVPAGMIPGFVRDQVNELTSRLGYIPVDDTWGTAAVPADLRTDSSGSIGVDAAQAPAVAAALESRVRTALFEIDDQFYDRWQSYSGESFILAVTPPVGTGIGVAGSVRWRVDLGARTLIDVTGEHDDEDGTGWDIVGSADAWERVLGGEENLGVAMRHCDLRYCDTTDGGPVGADSRIGLLAEVLGLSSSRQPAR